MNYEKNIQELKKKHFPELKHKEIILKKRDQPYFMFAHPLSKYIFYNKKIMDKCNHQARDAALIHELYHKLQFGRMNFLIRILTFWGYKISKKIRIKIERETNIETVKRGFGKGLILLNKYVKERVSKDAWKDEHSKRHLTKKEIKKLMKKFHPI